MLTLVGRANATSANREPSPDFQRRLQRDVHDWFRDDKGQCHICICFVCASVAYTFISSYGGAYKW